MQPDDQIVSWDSGDLPITGEAPSDDTIVPNALALLETDTLLRGAHPQTHDPDEQINGALVEHQLELSDWKFGDGMDLREYLRLSLDWYRWLREDEFLPSEWKGVALELPEHIRITFEPRPVNELGFYVPGRSVGDGALYRINLNPCAILHHRRSLAQSASDMLHEAVHLCEDLFRQKTGKPSKGGGYHSVEFRRRVELLGIPCTANGADMGIQPGSPFDKWLERRSIPRIFEEASEPEAPPRKLPKRRAWKCGCENAVSVMVPRASRLRAVCQDCLGLFRPVNPRVPGIEGQSKEADHD